VLTPDVAEGDIALERRRSHRTGYVADFFAVPIEFGALARHRLDGIREAQPTQRFRHLPVSTNTRDYFLADVAALGVTDRSRLKAGFGRQVGLVHVNAEARDARLDSGRLH